jgi:hypothetical protein
MAVKLWRHQCTVTGKEEINYEGEDCPHCGEKTPEPEHDPAPPADEQNK